MLVELDCEKFKDHRPHPITFTPGLNIVLGTAGATNSIGKSTTLMILDFVFGGDDYKTLSKDVKANIGDHTFKFAFDFSGEKHYYMRGTKDANTVFVCDKHYEIISEMPLKDYREALAAAYGVNGTGLSWRDTVSGTFRIWQRDNDKTSLPLSTHRTDTHRSGIRRLLGLFGKLEEIQAVLQAEEDAKAAVAAAKSAPKFFDMRIAANAAEAEENSTRIAELEQQIASLEQALESPRDSEVTAEETRILAELRRRQIPLLRRHTMLSNKLAALDINTEIAEKRRAKDMVEPLREFFPEVDLTHLEEIEVFRRNVRKLVSREAKKQVQETRDELDAVEKDLRILDDQIAQISKNPHVSVKAAEALHELKTELGRLRGANASYRRKQEYEAAKKQAELDVEEKTQDPLAEIEKRMNQALKEIDAQFTDDKRKQPKLALESIDKYSYAIADDTGTGSGYRSLISFDLALLRETILPVIIEDSMMFKQIETDAVQKIIAYYATITDKQVIISLDEKDKYDEETQRFIDAHTRLYLGTGTEALFAREWGKKSEAKK